MGKDLIAFKKNILSKIKEKLEIQKEELKLNTINKKWLEAFREANKNSEIIKPIVIDRDKKDNDILNIPYSTTPINTNITNEDLLNLSNYRSNNISKSEKAIDNSEELKEIYAKVKNNEINLDSLSETDLLKIYVIASEEIKLVENKFDVELDDEEEIKRLEKENEALRNEIETLKNKLSN